VASQAPDRAGGLNLGTGWWLRSRTLCQAVEGEEEGEAWNRGEVQVLLEITAGSWGFNHGPPVDFQAGF
jgi:hypothetical protein